ncbi:unnamed protein product, partial [marine sediment metagenome]
HNAAARAIIEHEKYSHGFGMFMMLPVFLKGLYLEHSRKSAADMVSFFDSRMEIFNTEFKSFKPVSFWKETLKEASMRFPRYMENVEVVFDMGDDGVREFVLPLPKMEYMGEEVRSFLTRYAIIFLRNRMEAIGPQRIYLGYSDDLEPVFREATSVLYKEPYAQTIEAINRTYKTVLGEEYEFSFIRINSRLSKKVVQNLLDKQKSDKRRKAERTEKPDLLALKHIDRNDNIIGVDVGGSDV